MRRAARASRPSHPFEGSVHGTAKQTTATVIPALQYQDAHFARKAAGAEIMREPVTQDYGGRDYTGKDPEGHVWTFGTYDPWAAH